jgi:hypothetical protein
MTIGGTTVGPLTEDVRDRLAAYRDREGFSNYNEAVDDLLKNEKI